MLIITNVTRILNASMAYWKTYYTVHRLALQIIADYNCFLELQEISKNQKIKSRKTLTFDHFGNLKNKYFDAICLNSAHLFGYYRSPENQKINNKDSHFKALLQCYIPKVQSDIQSSMRSAIGSASLDLKGLEDDFQTAILEKAGIPPEEFEKTIKNLNTYRNKTLAHIDHDLPPDLHHPFSELLYKVSCSIFYYLRFISTTKTAEGTRFVEANTNIDGVCEDIKKEFKETLKSISDCI